MSMIKKSQLPTTVLQLATSKYAGIVTSVDHTFGKGRGGVRGGEPEPGTTGTA